MKLINLTLDNFKGVKQFALDANGGIRFSFWR